MINNTGLVRANSLDIEKARKRMNWKTMDYFFDIKIIKIIIILSVIAYLAILGISIKIPITAKFAPSLAELVSVFVGLTLGFYWNKADETRKYSKDMRIINKRFIDELKANIPRLQYLYSDRYENNITLLLKTNAWEISKEKIGTINIIDMFEVEDIYHRINVINIYIEKYPYNKNLPKKDREYLIGTIETVKNQIPLWISTINNIYGWE